MAKRIVVNQCCGVVIDVQDFFLSQLDARTRSSIVMRGCSFFFRPGEPTKLGDCTTSAREGDCIPRFQPGAAISKRARNCG